MSESPSLREASECARLGEWFDSEGSVTTGELITRHLEKSSNKPNYSLTLDVARYAPLRNFIPKVFPCTLAPLRPSPLFNTIFVYSHISLCSFFSPLERQLEGTWELRPCVRVAARVPPQGLKVALLGPGAPPAVVAGSTACPLSGTGPRMLRAQSGQRRRAPSERWRSKDTLRPELGTVPGVRRRSRGHGWVRS